MVQCLDEKQIRSQFHGHGGYVFIHGTTIHALPLTITKLREIWILLMFHDTFANTTHISRPKFDEQIMKRNKKNSTSLALLICMTTLNMMFNVTNTKY